MDRIVSRKSRIVVGMDPKRFCQDTSDGVESIVRQGEVCRFSSNLMKLPHHVLHTVPLQVGEMWRFEKREESIAPVLNHRDVPRTLGNRSAHDPADMQDVMLDNRIHLLCWTFPLSVFTKLRVNRSTLRFRISGGNYCQILSDSL
jgi:hypothetical protein